MRRAVAVALVVAATSAAWLATIEPDAPRGPIAEADWIMPGAERIDRYPPDNCHPDVPGWQTAYQAPSSEPAAIRAWYRERHGAPVAATEFSLTYEAATVWIFGGRVRVRTYDTLDHWCPPRDVELWDHDPVTVFLRSDGEFLSVDGTWYGRDGEPLAMLPDGFGLRDIDEPAASLAVNSKDGSAVYVSRGDGAWLPYSLEEGYALGSDDYAPWLDIGFPGRAQRFTAKLLMALSGLAVAGVIALAAWRRRRHPTGAGLLW